VQVENGLFVFLNDIDFLPTPHLYSDLVAGRWTPELIRMSNMSFKSLGKRQALVLPAFERLSIPTADGGAPDPVPWDGPCEQSRGCSTLQGMKLPRNFEMLRTMLQEEDVVDVFHRTQVRFIPCIASISSAKLHVT
jgi:hypothetical protein